MKEKLKFLTKFSRPPLFVRNFYETLPPPPPHTHTLFLDVWKSSDVGLSNSWTTSSVDSSDSIAITSRSWLSELSDCDILVSKRDIDQL